MNPLETFEERDNVCSKRFLAREGKRKVFSKSKKYGMLLITEIDSKEG